jgi:transposase-like protein
MARDHSTVTPWSAPEPSEGEPGESERGAGADQGDVCAPRSGWKRRIAESQVSPIARRRTFTAQYKLEILDAVEEARETGAIGALLRREGLYSSHLTKWKEQRRAGVLSALAPRRRGPKAATPNPLARRVAELERDKRRLVRRLAQAEAINEIQKKVSQILGIPLDPPTDDGHTW